MWEKLLLGVLRLHCTEYVRLENFGTGIFGKTEVLKGCDRGKLCVVEAFPNWGVPVLTTSVEIKITNYL